MNDVDERDLPRPFGRYVLTHLLGEGGMAEVYRASVRVAEGLTKWVVIKKIRPEFAEEREFTRMFVDEAKIALSLNHANIVQVFDFGQIRGTFYLAMELVEGLDLMRLYHAVRAQDETFPAVFAAYIGHQLASGLAYAHRKSDEFGNPLGIVHRDISPHNVMVSFDGQVKVLDFGIARTQREYVSPERAAAESETIKGKVAYMSPEQAHGRPVDQRSDIYSLGVVLFELLTGELQFRERDRLHALERVRAEPLPPIVERAPEVPDHLARIVDRALQRDPEKRYQSAREIQLELANFLHRSDPVVDDDSMREFLDRYRNKEDGGSAASSGLSQVPTREIIDSQVSGVPPAPSRNALRTVLLQIELEAQHADDEGPAPDPSGFLDVIRDIAFKREAHVHHLGVGGGLLVFGTLLAGGDDAERALRVARSLREVVGEYAPGLGLGMAMLSTHVSVTRGDDGGVGVELPPGLEEALEGVAHGVMDDSLLVAGDLPQRLSRGWQFGPRRFVPIPPDAAGTPWAADLQEVAPLIGPLSEAERRRRLAGGGKPLFGRELELKALRDAFAEAIRGPKTRSVLVVGDPGLGKRALIERFVASLPRGQCAVLRGIGQFSSRNQPLGVFLELLRRFLLVDANTNKSKLIAKLGQYGVREPVSLAEALTQALGLPGAEEAQMEPVERRERLGRLIRRLVRALASRRPVIILIENLHFVDAQSLGVLEEWAEREHPLPVLGISTSRPGQRAETFARWQGVTVVELAELDQVARREFLLSRFEDPEEAEPLADAILARTGGHPLFIEEVLASLIHRGVISWNAQARHLLVHERGANIELPPSVEGALRGRIDDLRPFDREVLSAAAILGRTVRSPELDALLERDTRRSVHTLLELGLLEREDAAPEILRFSTVSLHEVCKASVGPTESAMLHASAAALKRARSDYAPGRDDGPIAEHLVHAGRPSEAVEPALHAARAAEDVAGNVEAYYFLSLALKAMEAEDERRFEVLADREPILRAWGRRRAQGADIRKMLAIAKEAPIAEDGSSRAIIAELRLLSFYLECGRTHRAERLLPAVKRRVGSSENPRRYRGQLGALEADLLFSRGRFDEAQVTARAALGDAGEGRDADRLRVGLLSVIGRVQLAKGRFEEARVSFDEALELAQKRGMLRLEGEVLNALGEVAGRSTQYQTAVDHFRAAIAIDKDLGDRFATGTKLANLGLTYAAIGLFRRAERYLRKALELHDAIGHPGLLNDVIVSLGEVEADLGDGESARELLLDAARVARRREDVRTELRAEVRIAFLDVEAGGERADEGLNRAREVLERAREQGLRTAESRARRVLSLYAEQRGDIGEAIEQCRKAVDLVRAGANPLQGVLSLHHLGVLLAEHPGAAERDERSEDLLAEAASMVKARLDDLRDPDLREGYLAQSDVRRILADGGVEVDA